MRMLDRVYGAFAGLAARLARGRQREFSCGDCDRWRRCGLPPDENCVARAAQIERDGEYRTRRATTVSYGAAWTYDRG